MAVVNPPLHLTNDGATSDLVRRMFHYVMNQGEGVASIGSLAVSEKSGTTNMSVDVALGAAFVAGTESTFQGSYFVEAQSVTNVIVSAADPTNPRKDLIVARVRDSDYSGATDAWALEVVTGVPAGSPSEPAVPANSLVLAMVDVAAAATSIVNANIADRRGVINSVSSGRRSSASATLTAASVGAAQTLATQTVPAGTTALMASAYIEHSISGGADVYLLLQVDGTTVAETRASINAGDTFMSLSVVDLAQLTMSGTVTLKAYRVFTSGSGTVLLGSIRLITK